MGVVDEPGEVRLGAAAQDDLRAVERLTVGLVAFTTLHTLALAAARDAAQRGHRLALSGNRFLNLLTMSCGGRTVTFTRGFGIADDDVIQVTGIVPSQRLSLASEDDAVAVATLAMERAIHYLMTGYDLDAI